MPHLQVLDAAFTNSLLMNGLQNEAAIKIPIAISLA